MPYTVPRIFSTEGLTCGHDRGSRVAPDDYYDGFAFTGTIKRVTIDLSADLIVDSGTDMKVAMARQWIPPPGRSHRSMAGHGQRVGLR
ncbi:MAG TPA: hypothetical protein VI094_17875 [Propionibacteriaceae bacterium]